MYSNVYISVNNFFSFIKIPILSYINNYFIKIRKKKSKKQYGEFGCAINGMVSVRSNKFVFKNRIDKQESY